MFECKICGRKLDNIGNLNQHIKKCEKLSEIKEEIIDFYVNKNFSVKDLRKKFKLQSDDIKIILEDKVRSVSEANKLARKKYPNSFKHSEESKKIMREKRLEFMRNNPDKTAWRLSNISYPEKLFIEYVESNGLDKKYSIIREYSVFPYFIDFAFVNQMVAIEIDGSQHLLPERKERDNKKDKLLNDLGWFVIRISEKEIKTNIEVVFNKIISILNEKPKINNFKIGVVVHPKKYQKKERNEFGFTEKQIQTMKSQRKVERPTIDELKKLIKENGYRKTGKIFGVSDNAVRKWLESYKKGL
jgi:very-short-patch-repair endonuclease/DNA-binding Xre family transcriptional regulator